MAELNLIPNPGLVAVQAGIFLTNLVVAKKLMIDPYLKLRDRRYAETQGGQEEAHRALQEAGEKSQTISKRVAQAHDYAKSVRAAAKERALQNQHEDLQKAKQEAKSALERLRSEIQSALHQEKQKVPAVVESLTKQVYGALLR